MPLLAWFFAALVASAAHAAPLVVQWFDLDAVVATEGLSYEEQLLVYVFQGLVNRATDAAPHLMLNGAYINFDWPGADGYWRAYLTSESRVEFTNITASLCGLLAEGDPALIIKGTVAYDPTLASGNASEWALPIAATVAAQQHLLPVTDALLARFPCAAALPIVTDLRTAPWANDESAAWEWAFANLLPQASQTVAFNLYHYMPEIMTDPQSNATLANVDFAVQQNAFILNFRTTGNPATAVNPLYARALASMEPLFSAYGWTDDEFGFVWMTTQSGASPNGTTNDAAAGGGGAVFCSFSTPNLSFWRLLPIPGRTTARPLPVFGRGMPLNRSNYYVTIETNEGDTPRIVVSAFSKSWVDSRRGSLPVSWSIDPFLGQEFPALFDYFASTAGANDSFISGPGGCGYVYYGNMTDAQIRTFATRCGRLMRDYGPAVIDTYGQTGPAANTFSVLTNFSRYAAAAGVAPEMYISQPTSVIDYAYFDCSKSLDQSLPDGTPLLCTSSDPNLFYIPSSLGPVPCPSCTLAQYINDVASAHAPPFFITVYGGLKWTTGAVDPQTEFWNLWGNTTAQLRPDVVVVGAQEMARLARDAALPASGV